MTRSASQTTRAMGECVDAARAQHVGHANRREWMLIGADAFKPDCDPAKGSEGDADDPND